MEDANSQWKIADLAPKIAVFALPAQHAATESVTQEWEKPLAIAHKIAVLAASMEFAVKTRAKPPSTAHKIVVWP